MPIADVIMNSDLVHYDKCGCGGTGTGSDTTQDNANQVACGCGQVAYFIPPPPPIDVTKFPYPPYYFPYPPPPPHHCHCGDEGQEVKPSTTEKSICKLSKKASIIRQLIENLEEKNKPLIIKSGAVSYNFGSFKTKGEDGMLTEENENISTIIDMLKAELENIKEEIKTESDKITEEE